VILKAFVFQLFETASTRTHPTTPVVALWINVDVLIMGGKV